MIEKIKSHIAENIKTYFTLLIIFTFSLVIGIFLVNHSSEEQKAELFNYIGNFTLIIKQNKIDYLLLLKNSIFSNVKLLLIVFLINMSLFGKIGNILITVYKGFSLGYSISSIIITNGTIKGIAMAASLIFLSELIIIPTLFYIMIISSKFFNKIITNDFENKKIEILNFLISILIAILLMIFASLIETFIGSNLFYNLVS